MALSPYFHLQFQPHKPNRFIATSPVLRISASSVGSSSPARLPSSIQSLASIRPFVVSQWQPVLKGWLCSAISVYSLSRIVPGVGRFSSLASATDAARMREESLILGSWFLVRTVANYMQQAFLWDAALDSVYRIRIHVFQRVLERDLGFFEGRNGVSAGDIAYRITAEASDVADTIYGLLNTIVPSALQLSAMAAQMLMISPALSLISTLVIPSMALIVAYLGKKLRQISKSAHLSIATLSSYLNEVLPSILFVKANKSELSEGVRFQRLAHVDRTEHIKKKKMKALIPQIIQIIYFGALCIFYFGSIVVSRGSVNYSGVFSFITSLVLLIEPIQGVGKAYNDLKQGEPAIERLFDLTRFNSLVTENPDAVDFLSVKGDVKFHQVSFAYEIGMPLVLDELDLHIQAGETVALVGPSGGGKTTIAKLLLRLYDPLSGCIMIDNCNVQNIGLESLRRHVGMVSQDITLFSGTVAQNIGYRDLMTNIDMERVAFAAQTANAVEFIEALPEQYETNVGPRGSILSGGQRQRLAIARALYHDPSMLILDEATSALDSRSELLVRQAVQRLMENRTIRLDLLELDVLGFFSTADWILKKKLACLCASRSRRLELETVLEFTVDGAGHGLVHMDLLLEAGTAGAGWCRWRTGTDAEFWCRNDAVVLPDLLCQVLKLFSVRIRMKKKGIDHCPSLGNSFDGPASFCFA